MVRRPPLSPTASQPPSPPSPPSRSPSPTPRLAQAAPAASQIMALERQPAQKTCRPSLPSSLPPSRTPLPHPPQPAATLSPPSGMSEGACPLRVRQLSNRVESALVGGVEAVHGAETGLAAEAEAREHAREHARERHWERHWEGVF